MSPSIGAPLYSLFFLNNDSSSTFPISNNLCNVLASSPVVSDILFAALPVGAHKTILYFFCLYISIILLIIVVFPVPGPPVIIVTLLSFIALIASFCFSDNNISVLSSTSFNSFSIFDTFFTFLALSNFVILSAI